MKEGLLFDLSKASYLMGLSDSELKMMLFINIYLVQKGKSLFVNNQETRDYAESLGFRRTSVGYGNILSALVDKGILVREAKGVFSIKEQLFQANSCDRTSRP